MKVKELIEKLKAVDPDMLVVMSSDAEGNGFHPLEDAETGGYADGEVGLLELTEELKAKGYSEEDVRGEPAMVLWPSHA